MYGRPRLLDSLLPEGEDVVLSPDEEGAAGPGVSMAAALSAWVMGVGSAGGGTAIAFGEPVISDPSACLVTVAISVTTTFFTSAARLSYGAASASLASRDVARMARLEKVEERIARGVEDMMRLCNGWGEGRRFFSGQRPKRWLSEV